jgi:serine/threonine protein phosphatase PrpC
MPEPSQPQLPPVQPDATSSPAPAAPPFVLRAEKLSDVGRARDHQEDALGVFAPPDLDLLARLGRLYVVADGMGGHNAGEVASQAALQEIYRAYYAAPGDDVAAALRRAIASANQMIYQLARADARQTGMGTTAAVAAVRGRDVEIANVGDSRAYLIRAGRIMQITEDHSWVEEQVRAGVLTPEQARVHPQRNVITRALGTGPAVEPDLFTGQMLEGDVLLLCSDGLTGHLADAELLEIAGQLPPEQAVKRLVDLANERGGSDNISVIVVRAEAPSRQPAAAPAPMAATVAEEAGKSRQVRRLAAVAAAALLLILVVAAAAVLLTRPAGRLAETPTIPSQGIVADLTATPTSAATGEPGLGLLPPPTMATEQAATEAAISPTATLAPTAALAAATPVAATDAPRPTALAAIVVGGRTATPTRQTAGVAGEAPSLSSPPAGVSLPIENAVEFRWTGVVPAGHEFEVRLWEQNASAHLAAAAPGAVDEGNGRWVQRIRVDSAPGYRGPGQYLWAVAIMRDGRMIREAAPWPVTFVLASDRPTATLTAPAPTATPTVTAPARLPTPTHTSTVELPTPTSTEAPARLTPTPTETVLPAQL